MVPTVTQSSSLSSRDEQQGELVPVAPGDGIRTTSAEQFVALTAHEMQVPISVLGWNVSRLKRVLGEATERSDVSRVLNRLLEATLRLTTLVEDLLNLAKLHEGAFRLHPRPVQLTEIARRCLRATERDAERRGVALTWSWNTGEVPLTLGDPDRLFEVIVNLVGNGIKYTPRGGRVHVTIHRSTELAPPTVPLVPGRTRRGDYALVSIQDTGIGIPKDEQPHVFQQFFRGRKALATAEGGTGLGLYLVRTIVEQHRGAVWYVSREGYGTNFFFTVPVADPYSSTPAPGRAADTADRIPGRVSTTTLRDHAR